MGCFGRGFWFSLLQQDCWSFEGCRVSDLVSSENDVDEGSCGSTSDAVVFLYRTGGQNEETRRVGDADLHDFHSGERAALKPN